jgi:hypothetical protein
MTMTPNQSKLFALLKRSLSPTSKFYADDVADLRATVAKMPAKKVLESLARWNAVVSVTEAELSRHCQFSGLPNL